MCGNGGCKGPRLSGERGGVRLSVARPDERMIREAEEEEEEEEEEATGEPSKNPRKWNQENRSEATERMTQKSVFCANLQN